MSTNLSQFPASTEIETAKQMERSELPSIKDLPNADVVIFDGQCSFCRAQVSRLNWFANGRLAFLSLHDPESKQYSNGLSHDELMMQMYVVTTDGFQYGGAEAVRYLSKKLPRLWFLFPLLHLPMTLPIWNFLYETVARNRYWISGKTSRCEDGSCKLD